MIKERENLLFRKRHFCLGSSQLIGKKKFFPVQLVAKFSHVRCYLCKAMISFRKLVNLPILSCLCQAFAMSSDIKNDLLNLQKYLLVGETKFIIKNAKQISEKKIRRLSSCDWEILKTLTEDELSSALIYQLGII